MITFDGRPIHLTDRLREESTPSPDGWVRGFFWDTGEIDIFPLEFLEDETNGLEIEKELRTIDSAYAVYRNWKGQPAND